MDSKHLNLKFFSSLLLLTAAVFSMIWLSVRANSGNMLLEDRADSSKHQSQKPRFKTISSTKETLLPKSTFQLESPESETFATLKKIYARSISNSKFEVPILADVQLFESLLSRSLDANFNDSSLIKAWHQSGWVIHRHRDKGLIIIEEHESHRRGRGLFAIRTNSTDPIMLQAPHRFFDMHTGTITRKLFESFPIRAASWNSVHRKQFDVAHESRSCFNAFTRVMLQDNSNLTNIQIHGFDASKREDFPTEASETLAIVSNGTKHPNQNTKAFAANLKQTFGKNRVWLFPQETLELGATTNEQASIMRRQGSSNFLHVEMSKSLRESLVSNSAEREKLYQSFRVSIEQ